MPPNVRYRVPEEVLAKVRKHSDGAENLKTRTLNCHYCDHKSIIIFEDARGHVKAKCKRCGEESLYNVLLRRGRPAIYSFIK
jgi:transcription elongation factor Elf1